MKAEKKQFSNRMGAAVLLLALACVNGRVRAKEAVAFRIGHGIIS